MMTEGGIREPSFDQVILIGWSPEASQVRDTVSPGLTTCLGGFRVMLGGPEIFMEYNCT